VFIKVETRNIICFVHAIVEIGIGLANIVVALIVIVFGIVFVNELEHRARRSVAAVADSWLLLLLRMLMIDVALAFGPPTVVGSGGKMVGIETAIVIGIGIGIGLCNVVVAIVSMSIRVPSAIRIDSTAHRRP